MLLIAQIWLESGSDTEYAWVWMGVLALSVVGTVLWPTDSRGYAIQALVVGASCWMVADVRLNVVVYTMWILVAGSQVPPVVHGRRRSYLFTAASAAGLVTAGVWGGRPMSSILPLAGLVVASGLVMTAFYYSGKELESADTQMLSLFQAVGDAIVVTNASQRIKFANEAAGELFGYVPERLVGESLGVLLPERFAGSHAEQYSRSFPWDTRTLSSDQKGLSGKRSNGEEFPLEISVSKLESEGETFALAIIRDVTERVRLLGSLHDEKEKLEAMVMELEASHEERSRLIASVAHELRTPLTVVVGYADILIEDKDIDAETRSEFNLRIARGATDLAGIVEDLVTGARLEVDRLTVTTASVEVGPLVQEVVDEHLFLQGGTIPVTGSAKALGDPQRIRQIVRNLLTNALRHGGEVISVTIRERSGAVDVSVLDNGDGIKEEDRERIFEPFETAHSAPGLAPSLGLGLTLARTLAELMGGELTYTYEPGRSIFTLTLQAA